ncbi:hypothetical protein [Anaeromyxobacter terrae]|uniref:hypothetical protein n=1 Tax=Anaeromyxobacter terrae TaxID=2925406 RepID=UPI001F5A0F7C|nr:hypothetical protein [Anaeromyxobacter sp. SG22]
MRRLAFLALAALAACGKTTTPIGVGLAEPSAVVAFNGFTPKNPGLHPYFAIANAARSDLTLVDAVDDTPVLAPVIVRSLAVPVPDPRPALLAASSLWDGAAGAKADLLVVASAAAPALQLVETWNASARIVDEADLGALAPGGTIQALAAIPVLDAAVPPAQTPGRVRVVAALTGARLAVVEYSRAPDGVGIVRGDVSIRALEAGGVPFDVVSLAVNPHDPLHLYGASPDPIGGVEGVAELTVAGAPADWTIRALDARAPTRFVAAARLRERSDTWPPPLPGATYDDRTEFRLDVVDRVYALLDPARCGPDHRIGCGIAVLDPASGTILPDYAGLMPYLAPISLPQLAFGLAASEPPAVPPPGEEATYAGGFMKIAPGTGTRLTTAVAAIPSGDGRVYYADLGRFSVPNNQSILRGSTRTRAETGVTIGVAPAGETLPRILGLWSQPEGETAFTLAFDVPLLLRGVRVTPGFTATELWRVLFQASLPGVDAHRGQSGRTADARTWVAMQVPASAPGGATLTQVVRVYDPTFAIHPGDLVEMSAPDVAGCPTDSNVEARIAAILPPEDAYPGGALALEPLDDPRPKVNTDGSVGPWRDWPACVQALGAGQTGFHLAVRAGGLVAIGAATGYAGRPEVVAEADVGTAPEFALQYEDEDALAAQCPLLPWPADFRSAPAEFRTCDAACRLVCERLVLARKARRIYHVSDQCRPLNPVSALDDKDCRDAWGLPGNATYPFPRANGPVVAFRVGYRGVTADAGQFPGDVQALWADLRGMEIDFSTQSGITPSSRFPTTSSNSTAHILPLGISTFDRSVIAGKEAEGYRFLVPYTNDFVLDFSPAETVNIAKVIR